MFNRIIAGIGGGLANQKNEQAELAKMSQVEVERMAWNNSYDKLCDSHPQVFNFDEGMFSLSIRFAKNCRIVPHEHLQIAQRYATTVFDAALTCRNSEHVKKLAGGYITHAIGAMWFALMWGYIQDDHSARKTLDELLKQSEIDIHRETISHRLQSEQTSNLTYLIKLKELAQLNAHEYKPYRLSLFENLHYLKETTHHLLGFTAAQMEYPF
jgi:hypothetical protein